MSAFQTPTSSAETNTFQFETLGSNGVTVIDSLSSGIIMTVLPDTFTSKDIMIENNRDYNSF